MPRPNRIYSTEYEKRTLNQANRIIMKFGGAINLAKMLTDIGCPINPSSIYRWGYPKGKNSGTGGVIPGYMWEYLEKVARLWGMIITSEDLDPRPIEVKISKTVWLVDPRAPKRGRGRPPKRKRIRPQEIDIFS